MKAVLYLGPENVAARDVPNPKVEAKEVMIKVKVAGICGSDLEMYRGHRLDVVPPRIPGHEISGDVVEIGKDVKKFNPGDRVVVEPIVSCGECRMCRLGRYNICRNLRILGVYKDGAFAEYVTLPENRVYKLPKKLSYEEGAVLEPTAVGVHTVRRAHVSVGDVVVILGAGPIALQIGQVARAMGASHIIMTDVLDYRLQLAKKLGADVVVNVANEDPKRYVDEATDGEGADVVIEATGLSKTILQTMNLVRSGGTVHIAGLNVERLVTEPPTFFVNGLLKEVTVEFSRAYSAGDWPIAIRLASRGQVSCGALVSHRFPLDEAKRAYEVADKKLENAVKVVFTP